MNVLVNAGRLSKGLASILQCRSLLMTAMAHEGPMKELHSMRDSHGGARGLRNGEPRISQCKNTRNAA